MSYYKYYQPNKLDLKDNYGDCVIRAFTKIFDKSWIEIFDELAVYSKKLQRMPNESAVIKEYLKDKGYVWCGFKIAKGEKRPTPNSFCKRHLKGEYVLSLASHIVAVKDGMYHDTWDCGNKSLYGYWKKERCNNEIQL